MPFIFKPTDIITIQQGIAEWGIHPKHLVNYIFPNATVEDVWKQFKSGFTTKLGTIEITYDPSSSCTDHKNPSDLVVINGKKTCLHGWDLKLKTLDKIIFTKSFVPELGRSDVVICLELVRARDCEASDKFRPLRIYLEEKKPFASLYQEFDWLCCDDHLYLIDQLDIQTLEKLNQLFGSEHVVNMFDDCPESKRITNNFTQNI